MNSFFLFIADFLQLISFLLSLPSVVFFAISREFYKAGGIIIGEQDEDSEQ